MTKRYSFRLNEDDTDLIQLLEGIPSSKRSEIIREMLRYAYLKKMEEKQGNSSNERVARKLDEIMDRLDRLEEKLGQQMENTSEKNESIEQNALRKNAQSLLSAFGAFDSLD